MRAILVASTLGAAAVHLAAGQAHVEALGDLGLGFYWAALIQAGLAIAFVRMRRKGPQPALAAFALLVGLGITVAWAISRTVGLPLVPGGAEPIGTADVVATGLQLVTVTTLLGLRLAPATRPGAVTAAPLRRVVAMRRLPTVALLAVLGGIALSSTIALADVAAGHGHGPTVAGEHGHGVDVATDAADAEPHGH